MDPSIPGKLVLAAFLGGVIGLERQIRDKPAGLRTNILICVGSTLFMSISTKVAAAPRRRSNPHCRSNHFWNRFSWRRRRIAFSRFRLGLTTAATIWVVAGVGMAIGSGMYLVAVFATAMSFVTLYFLAFIEDKIQGGNRIATPSS